MLALFPSSCLFAVQCVDYHLMMVVCSGFSGVGVSDVDVSFFRLEPAKSKVVGLGHFVFNRIIWNPMIHRFYASSPGGGLDEMPGHTKTQRVGIGFGDFHGMGFT